MNIPRVRSHRPLQHLKIFFLYIYNYKYISDSERDV